MFFLIGQRLLITCEEYGHLGLFIIRVLKTFFIRGCNLKSIFFQMASIGVDSQRVVMATGSAIGAILAMHGYKALAIYGAFQFLGPLVYLSMTREFGSIISAIMVIARAGSAMTAEIGSMNISEQIDALITLSIDPIRYVVLPRVVATTLIMPFLSMFCVIFGVSSGYVIAVYVLGVNAEQYVLSIQSTLELGDITQGLVKSAIFGLLFSLICTFKGINARGGARGIGVATTEAVVFSCVVIFIADYLLGAIFFN